MRRFELHGLMRAKFPEFSIVQAFCLTIFWRSSAGKKMWTQCVVLPHSSIVFHQQPNLEVLSVYSETLSPRKCRLHRPSTEKHYVYSMYIYIYMYIYILTMCPIPHILYTSLILYARFSFEKGTFSTLRYRKKNDYSDSIQHWRDLVSSLLHLEFNEASTLAKGLANATSMIPETATIREEPPLAEAVKNPAQAWAGNGWLFQDSNSVFEEITPFAKCMAQITELCHLVVRATHPVWD